MGDVAAEEHLIGGNVPRIGTSVYINVQFSVLILTGKVQKATGCVAKFCFSGAQSRFLTAKLTQPPVVIAQSRIFFAPRISAAVEGIFTALHSDFITVVNTGRAGEGEL